MGLILSVKHECEYVGIVNLPDEEEGIGVMAVMPVDIAIDWVNHSRDIVDNGRVRFYCLDYAFNEGRDIQDVNLEDSHYTKLTPRFGADWQSTTCDAFTQLFTS